MEWFLALACGLVGLLVGSFLTTVVARVPAGESVREPGPRCRSCREPIQGADLVPVVSWVVLRGHCRICGAAIPRSVPVIEAATGVLFALTALHWGLSWDLPPYLYLASLAVAATAIDLAHHRLPDRIVLPSYPIVFALLILAMAGAAGFADLVRAVLGGAAMFSSFYLLAAINPSGLGGGDVKLAGVLGMLLGWIGWWPVIVGALASFFLGAIVGVLLMLIGRAGRKTHIPFGPFMFAGTYVGLLHGSAIGQWYLGLG